MSLNFLRFVSITITLATLLSALTTLVLHAQETTLRGTVADSEHAPAEFASVLLLAAADSSQIHWTVTNEEGDYNLGPVAANNYFIRVSVVGYDPYQGSLIEIDATQPEVTLPPITLAEDVRQLDAVEVQGIRPFIERKIDRTVINVGSSIVASGSTGLEVLEKAPGVVVDRQNNSISLLGKQGVIIHMDNRPTNLSLEDVVQMLSGTPSDNIERIELISNPSAKYDAVGNAGIINIVMKKSNSVGTNGSVTLAGGSGRFYKTRGSAQLNHRTAKVNLFGNYGSNVEEDFTNFLLYRNQADGEQRNIVDQEVFINQHTVGHTAKAGLDFFASKNTTLGVVWNGSWNNYNDRIPAARTAFQRSASAPVYLQTLSDILTTTDFNNQAVNLNWQQTFGERGGELTADVDAARFRSVQAFDLITNTLPVSDAAAAQKLTTNMPTRIDIFTYKVDYSRGLGGKWVAEAGVKRATVDTDSDLRLQEGTGSGELTTNRELSNRFQYTERVNAAYVNFSGTLAKNTEIQAGLRAEHTYSLGNSISLDQQVSRQYLNFFPSFFLSQPLSKSQTLAFSYSYRIDRPNYKGLNPARWYLDPYSFGLGNPFLQPQYTHSLELKHAFQDKIYTTVGASYINDLVLYLIEPLDDQKAYRTPRNAGTSQVYNVSISFPVTVTDYWEMQWNLMGTYTALQYNFLDTPLTAAQLSGRLNLSNAITLGKSWRAEVSGWLSTPRIDGMQEMPWLGSMDVGVQTTINQRWKAKLSVQDVFYTNRWYSQSNVPNFSQVVDIRWDSRVAMLSFTYTFGNQKLKGARQRKTGAEEEMNRAN